jgi:hypothetical protein
MRPGLSSRRVEVVLDLSKISGHAPAEHLLVELGARDAVAMLAGMRALVVAHQREGLLGDGPHRRHVLVELEVEHRAHMQAADRGMGIPGALVPCFSKTS